MPLAFGARAEEPREVLAAPLGQLDPKRDTRTLPPARTHQAPAHTAMEGTGMVSMSSGSEFGRYLAALRRESGKSQRRLAEWLCEISGRDTVTRHGVSRWERGERVPTLWRRRVAPSPRSGTADRRADRAAAIRQNRQAPSSDPRRHAKITRPERRPPGKTPQFHPTPQ